MIHPDIRQLQIAMITDQPNEILDWFNNIWNKLLCIEVNVYHTRGGEFIYYMIDDGQKEFVFLMDKDDNKFYCDTTIYWEKLRKHGFNIEEVQTVTHLLLQDHLDIKGIAPRRLLSGPGRLVDVALISLVD